MNPVRKYRIKCAVPGCDDMTSSRLLFPLQLDLLEKWCNAVKNPAITPDGILTNRSRWRICYRHFTEDDKMPELHRKIKHNAVPVLYLAGCESQTLENCVSSPTKRPRLPENVDENQNIEASTSSIHVAEEPNVTPCYSDTPCTTGRATAGDSGTPSISDVSEVISTPTKSVNCSGSPSDQKQNNTCSLLKSKRNNLTNEELSNCMPIDSHSHQTQNNTCSGLISEQNNDVNVEPSYCMPIDFDVESYEDFSVAAKTVVINSEYDENHADSLSDAVEGNEDQCDEPSVLETIKNEFCRICGINGQSLIPIFDDSDIIDSHKVPLVKMLETYLPLEIERGDGLPLNICYKCYDILHQWHELYVTCKAADRSFKNTFHQNQITVQNDGEKLCNRVEGEPNVSTGGEHNYVKLKSVTEPATEVVTELVSQQVLHGNKENICCETCGFYVTGITDSKEISSEILDLLERIPARIRLYVCKYCAELFKNRYELKDHIAICGDNPTICEICGALVPHRKYYDIHILRVHDDKRIICELCGELCRPYYFKNHQIAKHSQPENHCCELCCKIVHSKKALELHLQNHFKGKFTTVKGIKPVSRDGNIVFMCPVCYKMFNDKTLLIMHLNEVRQVKCPTCRLNLKNERFLLLHTCKTWTCQFCDKPFYSKMKWKDHELIHTAERPYKCKFCDAHFRSMHQRTVHHRTHRLPLLQCKYCSKKFKHSTALRNHMDFHEGIEFVCSICEKSFRRRTSFFAHIKKHGKNRYV